MQVLINVLCLLASYAAFISDPVSKPSAKTGSSVLLYIIYIVLCKAAVQEVFGSLKNRILLLTLVEVALVLYSTETYDYFIFLFCFVQIVNAD